MKRICGIMVAVLMAVAVLGTAEDNAIRVISPFDKVTVAPGSTSTSMAIDLMGYKPERFEFSLQLSVTNAAADSGLVTLSYELSNDGQVFPLSSNIVSGFSQTNSAGGDGQTLEFIDTGIARYIRFVLINETRTSNVSSWLCSQ